MVLWLTAAAICVAGLSTVMRFAQHMDNQEYYWYSDQFLNQVNSQFAQALNEIDGGQSGGYQDGVCYYAVAGGRVYTDAPASTLAEIQRALATPPAQQEAAQVLEESDADSAQTPSEALSDQMQATLESTQEAAVPMAGITATVSGQQVPLYSPLDYTWGQLVGSYDYSLWGSVFIATPEGLASLEGASMDYADWRVSEMVTQQLAASEVPDFDFILVYQPMLDGQAAQDEYDAAYEQKMIDDYLVPCLLLLGALAAVSLWLMIVSGRSAQDDGLHLCFVDHCPAELLAAGIAGLGFAIWSLVFWLARLSYSGAQASGQDLMATLQGLLRLALPTALGLLVLALVLSLVRQAKGHVLWRRSLCGRILAPLVTGRAYLKKYPPAARMAGRIPAVFFGCVALWIASFGVLSIGIGLFMPSWFYRNNLTFLALLLGCAVALGGIIYLYRMHLRDSRGVAALITQVQAAAKGESVPLNLPADNPFYEACQTAQQMGRNIQENVDARLKSERMKLDLITNVSHDLKTPLTSIIGYVDLLEKQELPAEAADYVRILRKKADRLSDTVQDLFTLAKSTSGSEPTPLERRDLVMALEQVLADMADTLSRAPAVRTALPEQAPVLAESGKLYRVLQNLLDNAARYSLAGTRIYLSVDAGPKATVLTVKNTAGYEMDFTAEEILQRFARGDKSRTGEGSGLGLSIAESFMRNFGGDFSVTVDGDQFAARCTFQTAPEADASRETPESGREPAGEDGGEAP